MLLVDVYVFNITVYNLSQMQNRGSLGCSFQQNNITDQRKYSLSQKKNQIFVILA